MTNYATATNTATTSFDAVMDYLHSIPISFETKKFEQENASISIASTEFSYYAEMSDRYMEAEKQPYSLRVFLETLRTINAFLKND